MKSARWTGRGLYHRLRGLRGQRIPGREPRCLVDPWLSDTAELGFAAHTPSGEESFSRQVRTACK